LDARWLRSGRDKVNEAAKQKRDFLAANEGLKEGEMKKLGL